MNLSTIIPAWYYAFNELYGLQNETHNQTASSTEQSLSSWQQIQFILRTMCALEVCNRQLVTGLTSLVGAPL